MNLEKILKDNHAKRYLLLKTGLVRETVNELLLLIDDGYRIKFCWWDGRPTNVSFEDNEELFLWAEYKQCDFPGISSVISDLLMRDAVEWKSSPQITDPVVSHEFDDDTG